MDLLVDSGSTKTLWTMVQQGTVLKQLKTEGINPYVHSAERILNLVQEKVLPELIEIPEHVHFYGAGCSTSANIAIVEAALQSMSDQMQVNVHHDLLAVARALCRHQPGIAVILGTGSNSCLYDGNSIVQHTPSLGYVLGDEGSGSYIAKQIIADIYHGIAPSSIIQSYHEYFDESLEEMLHSVYKEHSANAFLASKMPWVSTQLKVEYILDIIKSSFDAFIEKHLINYDRNLSNTVHCIGSIAFHFKTVWEDCLKQHQFVPGNYLQEPIEGLIAFHYHGENN